MEWNKKNLRILFLGLGALVLLYCLLRESDRVAAVFRTAWGLISPFAVGGALAFVLNVPMRGMERMLRKVPRPGVRRGLAMVLTLAALILVVVLVVVLLIPQLEKTILAIGAALPGFFQRITAWVTGYLAEHPEIQQWLEANTDVETFDWSALMSRLAAAAGNGITALLSSVAQAVGSVAAFVTNTVISIAFSLYCLSRKEILARQGRRLAYAFLPEKGADETVRILRMTNATFSNFISGQCLEALILGSLFAVAMTLFRMPYVPLVSLLVAVTALVPLVGAFVGCVLGAFFILVNNPIQAVEFVILFLVLQQIENNLIYPRVVGTSIGLPGMWVLVAVAVGGGLMGVGGMLLMIPVTSVLYALLREVTNNRLAKRGVAGEKLQDQPPELQFRLREKRQKARQKRSAAKKDPPD